jgi:all-trans-8'-apo-beta-carotenal 15,15'-oxygenase
VERTQVEVEQRGGEQPATPPPPPRNRDGRRYVRVDPRYQQFLDNWDRGFIEAQEEPEGYYLEVVQGAVPPEIVGTLFRNGPGSFAVGGERVQHPYDGDALVLSLAFDGTGRVFFRSRFVRTAE